MALINRITSIFTKIQRKSGTIGTQNPDLYKYAKKQASLQNSPFNPSRIVDPYDIQEMSSEPIDTLNETMSDALFSPEEENEKTTLNFLA